jgi:hypothetical protein
LIEAIASTVISEKSYLRFYVIGHTRKRNSILKIDVLSQLCSTTTFQSILGKRTRSEDTAFGVGSTLRSGYPIDQAIH